jgi:hypothetical protein
MTKDTEKHLANVNGTMPTSPVGVESTEQPTDNPQVKLFGVSVVADVQMSVRGTVNVYAVDDDEAIDKVQAQIEDEALDDDLEMEDNWSGVTLRYGHLKEFSADFQIGGVELVEDDVDPADVLESEVEELQASISWNPDALAKHKAFLKSLLNEGDDEQAVAA